MKVNNILKKKSWKKCSNFLDFRFIVKRRGVENAWSPNWFFHVGLKWVYLLERTFYILSRRFLRADNPVWPEENFYYRAGNIFGFFLPVVQFNYWIFFYSEDLKKIVKTKLKFKYETFCRDFLPHMCFKVGNMMMVVGMSGFSFVYWTKHEPEIEVERKTLQRDLPT